MRGKRSKSKEIPPSFHNGNSSSQNSSSHVMDMHGNASLLLWMLLDGIGLAIIAGCTICEGFELWKDFFNEYWDSNSSSLGFWFSGRSTQVAGLMFLIIHAASFQIIHEVEVAGMMLLTAGPLLNICACSLFHNSSEDPYHLFNKQWLANETLELIGIGILDLSMMDVEDYLVLTAELVGFGTLACAAVLDFDFTSNSIIPAVTVRFDMIHLSDCFGLGLLSIVAYGQYRIKVSNKMSKQHTHAIEKSPLQVL